MLLLLVAGAAQAITVQASQNPSTNGTFSNSASISGYYTTWTSNAASGLADLVITTGGNLAMCQQSVSTSGYGTLLALKTSTTDHTAESLTLTAPDGYMSPITAGR